MKKQKHFLYFAYGANMDIEAMKARCPAAVPIGKARLSGYRLNFRRGVATVEPSKGDYVPGVLWKVTTQCIKALDRFEGYPRFYDRRAVNGKDAQGTQLQSTQIYVMQPGYDESPPSEFYLNTILRGYEDFNFQLGSERKRQDCETSKKIKGGGPQETQPPRIAGKERSGTQKTDPG